MATPEVHTLNELFLDAIEHHPKRDAFLSKSSGHYQGLSSSEALEKVAALAVGLDRMGIRRGDHVAIFSENCVEWALTDYAILGLGAMTVAIYPTFLEPDLEYILRDSGARGVVVGTDVQLERVLSLRSRIPELAFVLITFGVSERSGVLSWKKLVESQSKAGPGNIDFFRAKALAASPNETSSILYTSGTMGQPKGVILSHANIVSNIQSYQDLFQLGERDIGWSFLPLSHILCG